MPKKAPELKPIQVARLTHNVSPSGKEYNAQHPVGGVPGLMLQVTPSGAKSWLLRVVIGSKRRSIGLGSYPSVTLAQARDKAREARDLIEKGIDPLEDRKAARERLSASQAKVLTFDQAAEKFLTLKRHEFRNPKHAAQWESTLATYASPVIGNMPVEEIRLAHVEDTLTRDNLWLAKTETAKRLRGRIEKVLDWCTAGGYREGENPARWRGNLDARLPNPSKVAGKRHQPALPIDDMPRFMTHIAEIGGYASRCLEFAILTATRSNEARGATWQEIDLKQKLWIVPAARMKASREHRVPLSDVAVALLKSLPRESGNELVFPSVRGGVLSENALMSVIKRMNEHMPENEQFIDPTSGRAATAHGFRSTFRDWAGERTSYPGDICEMALAHTIKNKAEAAYRRGDLLEKRRRLMADWARFCKEGASQGSVTPIRSKEG